MNKSILSIICSLFLLNMSSVCAGDGLTKTELRAAAFFPMGDRFRDVYGTVGVSLQAEVARRLQCYPCIELWGNVEWICMDGHPLGQCGSTDVDILNISLGVNSIGAICNDNIFVYAGIGPNVGVVFLENKMRCCTTGCSQPSITEHTTKVGVGGIIKIGGQYSFNQTFYLSLFADYLYMPVHFDSWQDVGGFKLGGGLGARF